MTDPPHEEGEQGGSEWCKYPLVEQEIMEYITKLM